MNLMNLDNKKIFKLNQQGIDMTKISPDVFDLDIQQQKVIDWFIPDFDMMNKLKSSSQVKDKELKINNLT